MQDTTQFKEYTLVWEGGEIPCESMSEQLYLIHSQHLFEQADGVTWYPINYKGKVYNVQIS